MTVQETELTFMRCPGCRSLVPPTATRCRMCGEALNNNQAQEGKDDAAGDPRKSRVRQRTMSLPPEEVESVKEQYGAGSFAPDSAQEVPPLRAEQNRPLERMRFGSAGNVEESTPNSTEVASKASATQPATAPESARPAPVDPTLSERLSVTQRALKDLESEFDTGEKHSEASEEAANRPRNEEGPRMGFRLGNETRSASVTPSPATKLSEPEDHEEEDDEEEGEEELHESMDASPAPGKKKRRRRRKKKGNAPAADVAVASPVETTRPSELPKAEPLATPSASPAPRHDERVSRAEAPAASAPVQQTQVAKNDEAPAVEQQQRQTLEKSAEVRERHQQIEPKRGKAVDPITEASRAEEGGLVGWFVNYAEDGNGVATEIRSGRFFICGEKLKDSDLVIEHDSVSTPHCVVKASPVDGLRVQDLLSESGTYVRKYGEDKFFQYTDSVTVSHGDWLRFGEHEVMVCLVALPKAARR